MAEAVGKFLGEIPLPHQPIAGRRMKNPIDKCTVVSIYPKKIDEVYHTIEPKKYPIEAGTFENPALLVIGSASFWVHREETQPTLEVPVFSISVANALINDYCNGLLACDMETRMPGLFFVEGEVSKAIVKIKYKEKMEEVAEKQKNWFLTLVQIGDSLWARANGNPNVISEEMKLAARELNLKDKPWLANFQIAQMEPCFACGTLKNPLFPICSNCKALDVNYKGPEIKFAG